MTVAPDRLTLQTCIGCGAIGGPGDCATGCFEQRLELVPAGAFAELAELASEQAAHVAAFSAVARGMRDLVRGDGREAAYRELQESARAALREHPPVDWAEADRALTVEPLITWWCAGCGAVDAPQPCLGVCIRRPVEYVSGAQYERARSDALVRRGLERDLRRLARRLAQVTPRDGHLDATASAFIGEATALLDRG